MCSYNNNIPISIPSHPYVLMNRSILCNCDIEAESNFLLESLAACDNSETKTDLVMYFTANLTFVNYFGNMIESSDIPFLRIWTTKEQILPISLESFEINASLLNAPKTLKDFVCQFRHKRAILELQGHIAKFQVWFFPQQFSSRFTFILSCIGNINYNASSYLCDVWSVKIENFGNKYSPTVHKRNTGSRSRHILCM